MKGRHLETELGEQVSGQPATVPKIHSQGFDTRETALVAGVDVGKLQNWLTRGAIQLKGEQNPGRGQSRKYAPYEVARIRLMKKLADVGVPLSTAFKLTEPLKKAWEAAPSGHELWGSQPQLKSWLLVLPAAAWPAGRKANIVRADDYAVAWLADQQKYPH